MARDIFENGVVMVSVKGRADSNIPILTQLGLADTPIRMDFDLRHMDIQVDAYGREIPFDVQAKLGAVFVSMNLVHVEHGVLREVVRLNMGNTIIEGVMPRAGQRLGGGFPRFAPGWNYVSLNLTSPVAGLPWRFYNAYLTQRPLQWSIGTERSLIPVTFRCIPYTPDPWNAGFGSAGVVLWDHGQD